jgi:hypothetical protein
MSAALTIRQVRAILDECPDPDALVFIDGAPILRVLIDRYLVMGTSTEYPGCLVIGSREECDEDRYREEVAS